MTNAADGQKVSTVLVDDSSELRALVRRRLEQSGLFEVVGEGGDGDEAISLVIRHEPDLLLLDTSMPTCDGIQALPAILAVCPETKVVMFTGFRSSRSPTALASSEPRTSWRSRSRSTSCPSAWCRCSTERPTA